MVVCRRENNEGRSLAEAREKKEVKKGAFTFRLSDFNVKATGGEVEINLWLEATTFFRGNLRMSILFSHGIFLELSDRRCRLSRSAAGSE